MSTTHESEGFVPTPLEGQGARLKDNYYLESKENEVSAKLTMSTKGLKRILLESLEIDEQEITLGVTHQKALHHAENSPRDVQRAYLNSR